MSVPALGRASLPPGPSCVHHFTVITVLIFVATVASDVPQDLCRQDPATFASQIHTIGLIDDALWAITKPDWNVYKLTPCESGIESLVYCMKVDPPVEVGTKWPQLVEFAKSAAKATDLTFPVDNSVVMDSSEFEHKVLAMHGDSFKDTNYFGFDFVKSKSVIANEPGKTNMSQGIWISSDVKDKAFRFFDQGKQVENIKFHKDVDDGKDYLWIKPCDPRTIWKICKPGSNNDQVQFQKDGACDPIVWSTVSKGVLFHKQFYLIASDLVYIFLDKAETESTKLRVVTFKDFFQCTEPTTLVPLTDPSSGNATTYERVSANSSHITTTSAAKGSSTMYIIIVSVVLVLVVILILGCVYYYLCWAKPPTDGKSDGNSKLASSSQKDSKVITKARTVSKGSCKQSQTKFKTVARDASLGKQSIKNAKVKSQITVEDSDAGLRALVAENEKIDANRIRCGFPPLLKAYQG